jgi:solute carrier family 35 protein E1
VCGVISFGAGAISFTHILKATEPIWAALIGAVFFRDFLPLPVYLSLLPIMGGVGLASMKEVRFATSAKRKEGTMEGGGEGKRWKF